MARLGDWLRRPRGRWTVYPTARLALLIACAGLGWLLPETAGRIAGTGAIVVCMVLAAWDLWRLPTRRDIEVSRTVPTPMGLGDPYVIRYEIDSSVPRVVQAKLYDAVPPGIAAVVADSSFPIGGEHGFSLDVDAVGRQRGRHVFGPVALRLTSPFGLVTRIVHIDLNDETVVVPSLSNVRRLRSLALQHRLADAGVRALRQHGEGSSFTGLRDYVPGDDPRLVDWKATARHARLITREQTIERSQTVIAMIDCGRAMTQLAGRYSRFEHVLSAALVLSDVAATGGDRVGLVAFDAEVRAFVPAQKGLAALRSLRTTLSALDATVTEPDYASAFRVLAVRQRRRALVVFFTDVIDVQSTNSFLAYATRAAQRHMLVVVAIQNEELAATARPSADGSAALFRSAAAEELVREREEALARMRRAGITVIDVAAGRMAAAVVNRYLEIKARGLL